MKIRASLVAHINRRQFGLKAMGCQCCGRRGAASRGVILVQRQGEDPLTPICSTAVLKNKGFWEQALQRPWIPVKETSWLGNLDRVLRKVTMWHQLRTLLGLVWILVPTLAASVSLGKFLNLWTVVSSSDTRTISISQKILWILNKTRLLSHSVYCLGYTRCSINIHSLSCDFLKSVLLFSIIPSPVPLVLNFSLKILKICISLSTSLKFYCAPRVYYCIIKLKKLQSFLIHYFLDLLLLIQGDIIFPYFVFSFFGSSTGHVGSLFSNEESKLQPLQRKYRVLTTGLTEVLIFPYFENGLQFNKPILGENMGN